MPTPIKFGTDGWRGVIAEDFTFPNVRIVTQAVADYLKAEKLCPTRPGGGLRYTLWLGALRDRHGRGAGRQRHPCVSDQQADPDAHDLLVDPDRKAGGASIITASHNPGTDNGYKYKPEYAGSASPEVIARIEANLEKTPVQRMELGAAERQGLVERFDATPSICKQLGGLVDIEYIKRAGLTVIIDAMYGAGAGYLPLLLDGGPTRVVQLNAERNPTFPGIRGPEPLDANLGKLKKVVKESGASVGLAFDGDADRVGLVDETGRFINQLQVFGLLTYYLLEVRNWRGPIVKSLSTTSMVERLGELYKVPVFQTPVGFKHIGPKMIEEKAMIGGEELGGFGFANHIPERDGILAALFLIDFMRGKTKRRRRCCSRCLTRSDHISTTVWI